MKRKRTFLKKNKKALKSYSEYVISKKCNDIPFIVPVLFFLGILEIVGGVIGIITVVGMIPGVICLLSSVFCFGAAAIIEKFYQLVDNSYHILYYLDKLSDKKEEQKGTEDEAFSIYSDILQFYFSGGFPVFFK